MLNPLENNSAILGTLIKKFYLGSVDYDFKSTDLKSFTWNQQEEFLNATVNSNLLKKFPVRCEFIKLFFKKLVQYLENNQDVHDDMYKQLCSAMKNNIVENFSYRHYLIGNNLNNVVTIKETNNMVINGTTGMRTWEAAIMLSDWALCNVETFMSKSVLELGSGIGFTGITIVKYCQPKCLYLSDCHEDVLNTINVNIDINLPSWQQQKSYNLTTYKGSDQIIGVLHLDWNSENDIPSEINPDVIIGADIIYDPTILQPLLNVIQSLFNKNNQLEVYIAGVLRNEITFQNFLELLDSSDLQYEKLHIAKNMYLEWNDQITMYLLKIIKNTL